MLSKTVSFYLSCTVRTALDEASDWVLVRVSVNAPVITSVSQDQTVFAGDNVVLVCNANGIPEPSRFSLIRWNCR